MLPFTILVAGVGFEPTIPSGREPRAANPARSAGRTGGPSRFPAGEFV